MWVTDFIFCSKWYWNKLKQFEFVWDFFVSRAIRDKVGWIYKRVQKTIHGQKSWTTYHSISQQPLSKQSTATITAANQTCTVTNQTVINCWEKWEKQWTCNHQKSNLFQSFISMHLKSLHCIFHPQLVNGQVTEAAGTCPSVSPWTSEVPRATSQRLPRMAHTPTPGITSKES